MLFFIFIYFILYLFYSLDFFFFFSFSIKYFNSSMLSAYLLWSSAYQGYGRQKSVEKSLGFISFFLLFSSFITDKALNDYAIWKSSDLKAIYLLFWLGVTFINEKWFFTYIIMAKRYIIIFVRGRGIRVLGEDIKMTYFIRQRRNPPLPAYTETK